MAATTRPSGSSIMASASADRAASAMRSESVSSRRPKRVIPTPAIHTWFTDSFQTVSHEVSNFLARWWTSSLTGALHARFRGAGGRAVELAGEGLADAREGQAALGRLDQPLPPQAMLDRHGVGLLEEERHERLEPLPDRAGTLVVVRHHALVDGQEPLGLDMRRGQDAAVGAVGEHGVEVGVLTRQHAEAFGAQAEELE